MATFTGSHLEFRRYIGPRLRNFVNLITKKHKAKVSKCQHCDKKAELESAHIVGRDRIQIIEQILQPFLKLEVVTVDISTFEELFRKEHVPLEKSILILCRSCHKKYDAKATLASSKAAKPVKHPAPKLKSGVRNPAVSIVDLPRLIQSVGQSTFVRYYHEFADPRLTNQQVAEILPSKYTCKSRISRTSHARKIFREGLEAQALELISASKRVDAATRENARKLLATDKTRQS